MSTPTPTPTVFRKAGKCVKVVSPTKTRTIILPPQSAIAQRTEDTYPDEARMRLSLEGLEPVADTVWNDFYFSFHHAIAEEREIMNRRRDELRKKKLQPNP